MALLLSFFQFVSSCPTWKCADLGKDICAEWDEKYVRVNTNKCSSGKHCYIIELELEKSWRSSGKVLCDEFQMELETNPINCGSSKKNDSNIKSNPIKCFKNSDCVTRNGKEKYCICSMDGNSYCELSSNDPELLDFHNSCYFLNKKEAYIWYLYIDLYPILFGVQSCSVELFEDLRLMSLYSDKLKLKNFKLIN